VSFGFIRRGIAMTKHGRMGAGICGEDETGGWRDGRVHAFFSPSPIHKLITLNFDQQNPPTSTINLTLTICSSKRNHTEPKNRTKITPNDQYESDMHAHHCPAEPHPTRKSLTTLPFHRPISTRPLERVKP
jgi:hypothetical protein